MNNFNRLFSKAMTSTVLLITAQVSRVGAFHEIIRLPEIQQLGEGDILDNVFNSEALSVSVINTTLTE